MNAASGATYEEMIREYRDAIKKLERRRRQLQHSKDSDRVGRLAALEEEIDELYEALALMRKGAGR